MGERANGESAIWLASAGGAAGALAGAMLAGARFSAGSVVSAVLGALSAIVVAVGIRRLMLLRRVLGDSPRASSLLDVVDEGVELRPRQAQPRRLAPQLPQERETRSDLDVLRRYLRDARDSLGADELVFWRADHEGTVTVAASTAESESAGAAFLDDEPRRALLRWCMQERLVVANDDERSLVLIGPVGKGERLHGALGAHMLERHAVPRERLKSWLGRHASHLAALLELLDDARSARRYQRGAQHLLEAVERIQSNLDLEPLAAEICSTAALLTPASRTSFILWTPDEARGQVYATTPGHPVPVGLVVGKESLAGEACAENQRFAIQHLSRMAAARPLYGTGEPERRVASIGIIPVQRDRRTLGAIVVEGDAPAQISSAETEALHPLATVVAVALEHALQYSQAWERASRDALTGLWNRRSFEERLQQLLAESDRFGHATSLILVDLDQFKMVNDTYGHDAGDAALRRAGQIITNEVRAIDHCARHGGDELAVLLPQTPLNRACEVAERLRSALESQPVRYGDALLPLSSSLGVATYPHSTVTRDGLFAMADRALYSAKSAGRNCVRAALVRTG